MPLISVIIPAFNRDQTIGATLASLAKQSLADWEAIVVDDGSTDATAAIVDEWRERDSRVRLHRQENAGVSAARNAGLGLAEGAWVFFLDADDWIATNALEVLHAAVAHDPTRSIAIGRSALVMPSGAEIVEHRLPPVDRIAEEFARRCVHSIHTSLQPTALVRAVGGFDRSLVTSEDWDLWQRIARTGPRYVPLDDLVAYYRIREQSASRISEQLLADALTVIARGHDDDPRLRDWPEPLEPTPDPQGIPSAVVYMAAYCGGLAIGSGADTSALIELIPPYAQHDVEGRWIAYTLLHSVAAGRLQPISAWREFPPDVHARTLAFVDAVARKLADRRMLATASKTLEILIAQQYAADADDMDVMVGGTHIHHITLGCPVTSQELPPLTERSVVSLRPEKTDAGAGAAPPVDGNGARPAVSYADVREAGWSLKEVTIPCFDGVFVGAVAADAAVAEIAWELIGELLADTVRHECVTTVEDGELVVSRNGVDVGATAWRERVGERELVHEAAGWTLFLQELWGLPNLSGDDFYEAVTVDEDADAPDLAAADGRCAVEISGALPRIVSQRRDVLVEVSLAGLPLMALRVPVRDGQVAPHRLRRAISLVGQFELCQSSIRELVLAGLWGGQQSLRARLSSIAASRADRAAALTVAHGFEPPDARRQILLDEVVPAGRHTVVLGRRRSPRFAGSASRPVGLPSSSRAELLEQAERDGQLVVEQGEPGSSEATLYVPWIFEPDAVAVRVDPDGEHRIAEFERVFESADPWDYESAYERRKYQDTLRLVPDRVESALEIGCAEGAFTAMLAPRAGRLLAVDISPTALDRARERCAALENVAFAQVDMFSIDKEDEFESVLQQRFDLIVCSEVLYYSSDLEALRTVLSRLSRALNSGGHLIVTHANLLVDDPAQPGFDWDCAAGAVGMARQLAAQGDVLLVAERASRYYRAQRWQRRSSVSRAVPRRVRHRLPALRRADFQRSDDVPAPRAAAARTFKPAGGSVERGNVKTARLPVLMYHRVAPATPTMASRWAVTPHAFEEQLAWLREHSYESVSVAEWGHATDEDVELDGKRVLITFDDGLQDFADHALPLLLEYGFCADMHIVTGCVGRYNEWEAAGFPRYPLMDWETIRALPTAAVSLGAHTVSHPSFAELTPADATDELVRSRLELEDQIGRSVTRLAYPYGVMDDSIVQLAGAAGFEYAYTTEERFADRDRQLLRIPRLEVRGGMAINRFGVLVTTGHPGNPT